MIRFFGKICITPKNFYGKNDAAELLTDSLQTANGSSFTQLALQTNPIPLFILSFLKICGKIRSGSYGLILCHPETD
jgi:hypothetical protein